MHTILRFREHKLVVSAAIEGMFLQVGVLEQDQPSIRFLWRNDHNDDIVIYEYGDTFLVQKTAPRAQTMRYREPPPIMLFLLMTQVVL